MPVALEGDSTQNTAEYSDDAGGDKSSPEHDLHDLPIQLDKPRDLVQWLGLAGLVFGDEDRTATLLVVSICPRPLRHVPQLFRMFSVFVFRLGSYPLYLGGVALA